MTEASTILARADTGSPAIAAETEAIELLLQSRRFNPNGDGGCEMQQEVHFGFSLPILGPLLDLAMRVLLPVSEFRRHMREEGDNLATVIQGRHERG